MSTQTQKGLSPRKSTFRDRLSSEAYDVSAGWIAIDATTVTIAAQRFGEPSTGRVDLPKRSFDALVDWYIREQKRGSQ